MNLGHKITFGFSLVVVCLILFLGVMLLTTEIVIDRVPRPNRTYLGFVFILYSTYRGYRANKQFKQMKNENEN